MSDCTRSHPHENMDAACEAQTIVARADNQWVGDMMILQTLSDSDCVNEQERAVLSRWMERSYPPSQRIERLQAAIEGECCGLCVDEKHARAILDYIDGIAKDEA